MTIEAGLAELKQAVSSLVTLKEQLQKALEGARRRVAGTPAPEPAPTGGVRSQPASTRTPASLLAAASTHTAASPPASAQLPSQPPVARGRRAESTVTIIHLEDSPALQEAVRGVVEKFDGARYCRAGEPANSVAGRRLLALNLLSEKTDPLTAASDSATWGIGGPSAFTYCADSTRGLVLGMVDFFPPPFEPDAWVTRLLERAGTSQRLLLISDAVDTTSELRSVLSRLGCGASVAFDARQALDLIPMVRPNVILLDLNLPRGEALRVISRVRGNRANGNLTFALMWQSAVDGVEFQRQASRLARDFPFSSDLLRRAMGRELSPGGAAYASPSQNVG